MTRRGRATLVGALGALGLAVAPAAAEKSEIKQAMGENFAGVHTILVALVTSSYANVPDQADTIRAHAMELRKMVPESAKDEREQFLTYASSLQSHAEDLKSISKILMQHDQERKAGGKLATDHLRESLAAHYGGMVTTCVACHNRYRPQVVSP